ncbi:MAG: hypothetical protein KKB59_14230 [Spirochaetes bacterium]|nr:hypothetical protein [Spirochaetota bacterium]
MKKLNIEQVLIGFGIFTVGFVIAVFILSLSAEPTPPANLVVQMEFRTGYPPLDMPALSVYEYEGVVTMVSSQRIDEERLLLFNVYGGSVPYDILTEPIGWTTLPANLLEILR